MSGPTTPSPTGSIAVVESGNGTKTNERPETPATKDAYVSENETQAPSKEEIEANEKNLQQSASYLGQLVFKLR